MAQLRAELREEARRNQQLRTRLLVDGVGDKDAPSATGRARAGHGHDLRQIGIVAISPCAVDGVYGGEKVVHIRLHEAEFAAGPVRALPAAIARAVPPHTYRMPGTPLFKGAAEVLQRNGVLPRHARGPPPGVRRKARGQQQALPRRKGDRAVHRLPTVVVYDILKPRFRLAKICVEDIAAGIATAAEKDGERDQQKKEKKKSRILSLLLTLVQSPACLRNLASVLLTAAS